MSNCINIKQITDKSQNEDSSILSNSTNTSFSENLFFDINSLKSREIVLISRNFESKIPEILSSLQNESNSPLNKLPTLKYLENLFTKINFNSEIFSYKFSNDKEKLNLFQIIINQYVNCPNDKDDYLRELKDLFTLLLSQITLDKDTYHYIFSFFINYINKCNNNGYSNDNQDNNNINLTSERISRILQLLQIYYQSVQTVEEPYNYFFFNGENDSYINIINRDDPKTNKKILNLGQSLNILIFIKLCPSQIIKQVHPLIKYKIIDIIFNNNDNKISIGIDKNNYLTTNFTSEKLVKLQDNKMISILVRLSLKDNIKTEIFVNNEKVEILKDNINKEKDRNEYCKEYLEIKELRFFRNFIGICSNIMIYKESEKDKKKDGSLPKFFTISQIGGEKGEKKEKFILKPLYLNGIYKEELFEVLVKQELKDKVDDKIIKDLDIKYRDKSGENEIKEFLDKNLIAIYMPNRIMIPDNQKNKTIKNANQLILKDSINNLDATFNINSPNLNGVHILTRFYENFIPFGGLNHFLPIIEIMSTNEDLLLNENLTNFFTLISSIFMPSYLIPLKNENDSNFFFTLSYFLEKIPDSYFDEQLASKFISISSFLIYLDNNYLNIIQQFHNYILMNENILFKFNYDEQILILQQIRFFIECSQREEFDIDIMQIINILLHYDKERCNKFCCKFHSEYFKESSEILSPELNTFLQPMGEILSKLFDKFFKEASQFKTKENVIGPKLFKIFEMLTIDISPCLQKLIINLFYNYIKKNNGNYFSFIDTNSQMLDITLFILKSSIFDVKVDAFNLLILLYKYHGNMIEFCSVRSKTNVFSPHFDENIIDKEKEIFIQNNILPLYLFGEEILVSNSPFFSLGTDNNIFNNSININTFGKNDSTKDIKTFISDDKIKPNKPLPNEISNFNLENYEINKSNTFSEKRISKINQNVAQYNYMKITPIQMKIYQKYKKKKLNKLVHGLYDSISTLFKEKIRTDFILKLLVKIVSKGDIILIYKFLEDLKKESESKEVLAQIYNSQQLFHWLLDTSFQAYMIKESNFDEEKFTPGFCIDPIDEESFEEKSISSENEIKIKIEEIFQSTTEFIINIIKNNIYKLDYIFTWSKYYYEMKDEKNNFEIVHAFLLKIVRSSYKLPHEISFLDKKNNNFEKESIYYLNLLFELLTFYKLDVPEIDETKDENQLTEEFSEKFRNILMFEINCENNAMKEKNIMKTLNIKWSNYPFYEKIYSFFRPLWVALEDKKKKDEKNNIYILKKYIGKKNAFINELEFLFYSFEDFEEFHESPLSKFYANKGIKIILMIFHFFILLFNIGGNEVEIKNLYYDFRLFITLIIISSATLITTQDTKKQKWPKESQYKEVQEMIKLILCYSLFFFVNKIKETDNYIKKYNGMEKNEELDILNKHFIFFHKILIETLGYILKIINAIFRESGTKKYRIFSSSEISTKSAPYMLSGKFYSIIEEEAQDNNNNENSENFLDNILKINIKRDSKEIDSEYEKNVYLFINSSAIQQFISTYINEDKNKNILYPFWKCIYKRKKLIQNIIPIYDIRENLHHDEKHIYLIPNYIQECDYNKIIEQKIRKLNKGLIKEVFINKKKINLEENEKINEYKRIKKKLFSFTGIWSKEEFFYESKYHLKYKLVNHLTEDFSKVLLTPILDLDYYLPIFSRFQTENLFRNPKNQIPIYYLVDLSFALKESHKRFLFNSSKDDNQDINLIKAPEDNTINNIELHDIEMKNKNKEDKNIETNINIDENYKININQNSHRKESNNSVVSIRNSKKFSKKKLNPLFDIKLENYSFNNSSNTEMEEVFTERFLFSEVISQKHLSNSTGYDIKVDSCLIKTELHICGIFYNNSKEIGFYGSERIHTNEEEDYDFERKICFGSIFKEQGNKYNNYYLKIPYSSIEFILIRKYYFRNTVLEIFTVNKKSYSFRFEEEQMKKVLDKIIHYMKMDIEDIFIDYTKYGDKIGFFNKKKKLNNEIEIPNLIKNMNLKYLYEKWAKWEISTLKLLMILNLYGNRSYNDINQYPVFPWIITDYSSDVFSFNFPLRPLGTPMGMLDITEESKERKENFINTWKMAKSEDVEEDFDRYRTHYSASLYITYYMVKVFPFSSMRLELQGTNFDVPNRLFNSLDNSFYCASTQKADIRELIPEIFCFPELFYNINKLNLGEIRNKEKNMNEEVNNTILPKWANNDGYTFINYHRMLLESPEVNEKINEWFNIIFGPKQKGNAAKKIGNLFIQQSYESFEEIYNKSEKKEKIYFCRMSEFGVTPHQIFKSDTYKRYNYNELKIKKYLFPNITEIIKKKEIKNLEISKEINIEKEDRRINTKSVDTTPIKFFIEQNKEGDEEKIKIYVLNEGGTIKILKNEQQSPLPSTSSKNLLLYQNLELNFSEVKSQHSTKKLPRKKVPKVSDSKNDIFLFLPRYRINYKNIPSVFFNEGNSIALGGFWNGNILIENILPKSKKEKSNYPETKIYSTKEYSPITHMQIDKNEIFVICGNLLGNVFIYIIDQNDKTIWHFYKAVYDHYNPISSLAINTNLNIFITCSKEGYCMIYTLPKCKLINSFKLGNIINNNQNSANLNDNENISFYSNITLISNSPLPCIIFYLHDKNLLVVFSINGHLIKEQKIDYDINTNSIKLFKDQQFIDYLLIYNKKEESINIYNIMDLKMIISWQLVNFLFIDFIFAKELDNIFILGKYIIPGEEQEEDDENNYKILVLRCVNDLKSPLYLEMKSPLIS